MVSDVGRAVNDMLAALVLRIIDRSSYVGALAGYGRMENADGHSVWVNFGDLGE